MKKSELYYYIIKNINKIPIFDIAYSFDTLFISIPSQYKDIVVNEIKKVTDSPFQIAYLKEDDYFSSKYILIF